MSRCNIHMDIALVVFYYIVAETRLCEQYNKHQLAVLVDSP